MSYILDAIKKADQKRKLGEVPDLDTVHEAPVREPRRFGWLYGLAALLFVNAGGLAWFLWLKAPENGATAQKPAGQQEIAGQQAPQAPVLPAQKAVGSVPEPVSGAGPVPSAQPAAPLQSRAGAEKVAQQAQPAQVQGVASAPQPATGVASPAQPATPAQAQPVAAGGGGQTQTTQAKAVASMPQASPAAVPPGQPATAAKSQPGSSAVAQPPQAAQAQAVAAAPQSSTPAESKTQAVAAGEALPGKAHPPVKKAGDTAVARKSAPAADLARKSPGDSTKTATPPPANEAAFVPVQEEPPPASVESGEVQAEEATAGNDEEAMSAEVEAQVEELTDEGVEQQVLKPIAMGQAPKDKAGEAREEEDPELANIPFLKQLPADIQKSIPEMHIAFHSYSHKPASRLVSIGGKILREGQDFEENLKLVRITNKGVVFNYKGKLFRIDV